MGVSCLKKTKTETKHNNIPLVNDKIIADFFLGSFLPLKGDRAGEAGVEDGKCKTRNHLDFTIDKDKIIADFFSGSFLPLSGLSEKR